ncbi:hypothetical protein BRADI_1g74313v3 [Brachypodium distachyon]|uniref:Uncharacterized protein n=1 Tax=Brachypodium distachyon TaxID=15368 RepID=A0A2K2DV33_BRADI|nr:hypothetical protein BRADI_1g74313v3 [Brachypodium distachyon]
MNYMQKVCNATENQICRLFHEARRHTYLKMIFLEEPRRIYAPVISHCGKKNLQCFKKVSMYLNLLLERIHTRTS